MREESKIARGSKVLSQGLPPVAQVRDSHILKRTLDSHRMFL